MATTATKPVITSAAEGESTPSNELSPAQQRAVERLRDNLNRLYGGATQRLEELANTAFRELFDGDVDEGLSPHKSNSARYQALLAMCGDSLHLDRGLLSRAVRIGALNSHFADRPWTRLPWSIKVELLPLLGADGDLKRLSSGITNASRASATVRSVREWVAANLPTDEKSPTGRPRALSLAATSKMFASGRQLKLVSARRLLVLRLRRLGKSAVDQTRTEIDVTIKSLTQLREELSEE